MRADGLLLGIDVGTSASKVAVIDAAGEIHGEASAGYVVRTPRPGWAESEPEDWWRAVRTAVRAATAATSAPIVGIGVAGQMHGVILADASGRPVRPAILWADTRAASHLSRFTALGAAALERLANPVVAGMAGPTLLWLRDHEPEIYAAARWALQPKDWLRRQLTGRVATEPSDASATLLYDLPADDWAWSPVHRLGLRGDQLPPLIGSATAAGTLTVEAADALGLSADIPVAAGAGDTPAAALGSGLLDPGPLQVIIGTGGQVLAPRDRPDPDPTRRTHIYRAVADGRWYAMAATLNAGLALDWARRVFAVDWDTLYEEALAVAPGAGGVRFLPYLSGERTPHLDANARGAWTGVGLSHHRGHLLRAVLEGVAFALRDCVAAIEAAGPDTSHGPLRLGGGGSVVPAWRQLLTDVLRRPLAAVDTPNASVRGAALLAGVAVGIYPDVRSTLVLAPPPTPVAEPSDSTDIYEPIYEHWRAMAGATAPSSGPTFTRREAQSSNG